MAEDTQRAVIARFFVGQQQTDAARRVMAEALVELKTHLGSVESVASAVGITPAEAGALIAFATVTTVYQSDHGDKT